MDADEEEYFIPLEDQRVFGAGIKRKRVPFVPASASASISSVQVPGDRPPAPSVGDKYLSIVLPATTGDGQEEEKEKKGPNVGESAAGENEDTASTTTKPTGQVVTGTGTVTKTTANAEEDGDGGSDLCPICHQPLTLPLPLPATLSEIHHQHPTPPPQARHDTSITHQLHLPHSHPPSHLPRAHVGLRYLTSYGWDPDARKGLGAHEEGIRAPIKAKVKNDTVGLGADGYRTNDDDDEEGDGHGGGVGKKKKKTKKNRRAEREKEQEQEQQQHQQQQQQRLDAKQVRKQADAAKLRADALRDAFYGRDLDKYLGPGG